MRAGRALVAFVLTALAAVVWMRVARFAYFPYGGGEFHWVLHLSKPYQVLGIYGFAATQALAASLFVTLVCCAPTLRLWHLIVGVVVPVVVFNAVFSHPIVGAWAALTSLPCLGVTTAIWWAVRRWPARLPWPIVALLTLIPTVPGIAGFTQFFPEDTVASAIWSGVAGSILLSGAAVLSVRAALAKPHPVGEVSA